MPFDSAPVRTVASQLRQVFGPNGEHWLQGRRHDRRGSHCLVGAIYAITDDRKRRKEAIALVASLLERDDYSCLFPDRKRRHNIERFNDCAPSFATINRLLTKLEEKELSNALR